MSTVADLDKEIADRQRQIERLQDEIQALRQARSVLSGDVSTEDKSGRGARLRPKLLTKKRKGAIRSGTISSTAAEVIREAGKPLPIAEIVAAVKDRGNTSDEVTIQNVIYRDARVGRVFRLVNPGTFGLLN